jgi:hypothetical protein
VAGRQPATGDRGRPSRRAVLTGGLGVALLGGAAAGYELVQNGALPGKFALARLDGSCGSPPPAASGPRPSRQTVSFRSAYRRCQVTMVTLVPEGARPAGGLHTVIVLHGAGGDAVSMAGTAAAAMASAGITSFAAITVDGGSTYWHQRADGDDPLGMIEHEVLPRAAAGGLNTAMIGIAGVSMGGYGALLLAERLGPAAAGGLPGTAGVAALSPAIFATYADAIEANRRSFDSPADFARNDVQAGASALRRIPAWIAVGSDDPFKPQAAALRSRLAALTGHQPAGGFLPGCHDDAFFARNLPGAFRFVAARLREQSRAGHLAGAAATTPGRTDRKAAKTTLSRL